MSVGRGNGLGVRTTIFDGLGAGIGVGFGLEAVLEGWCDRVITQSSLRQNDLPHMKEYIA